MNFKKISIIGNPCSGKTTLSRSLSQKLNLTLIHVDSIQYIQNMNLRDPAETRDILLSESNKPSWIIDGLGPLKIIEDRFKKSDLVIVIRIPLWVNLLWAVKRQIKSIFVSRKELPTGSNEASLINSIKLFKNIWNVQHGLWLQLDRIFLRDEYKHKVKYVSSLSALNYIIKNGLN